VGKSNLGERGKAIGRKKERFRRGIGSCKKKNKVGDYLGWKKKQKATLRACICERGSKKRVNG